MAGLRESMARDEDRTFSRLRPMPTTQANQQKKPPLNGEEDASQLQALAVKVATAIIYVQLKLIP